ncbi:glycine cleavage system protein H [candidate division KSB1 bacterium RBG_16_48_16]|nr:MAG: glycine cleavage system protein H [candidate division KSB1 bacterium RBG_16_48_16]
MSVPADLRYTEEHEWVRIEDGIAVIGITEYAQSELGDIVFVELPKVGAKFKQMDVFGTIEAVKAVSDLFAPVGGEVVGVNDELAKEPELINKEPYGKGWMIKIKMSDSSEYDKLLSDTDYKQKIS